MVVRWKFDDPTTLESWTFELNPSEDNTPAFEKNHTYVNTSGPDGKVVVFEGRDNPRRGTFSGTVLTEQHYNTLHTWWAKRSQIKMTDDLGRENFIIIESFSPERARSRLHPWRHNYQISYTIVDWA